MRKIFFVLAFLFFVNIGSICAFADTLTFPNEPNVRGDSDYYYYTDYYIIRKTKQYYLTSSGVNKDYTYYLIYYNDYNDTFITKDNGQFVYNVDTNVKTRTYQLIEDEWVKSDYLPFGSTFSDYSGSSATIFDSITYYNVLYNTEDLLREDGSVFQSAVSYYNNKKLNTSLSKEFSISNLSDIFKTYKYLVPILLSVLIVFIAVKKVFKFFKKMLGGE